MTTYALPKPLEGPYTGFMKQRLNAFWKDETGQEMVEYTLLVAFFALAGVGVLSGLRGEIVTIWQAISASYATAAS